MSEGLLVFLVLQSGKAMHGRGHDALACLGEMQKF